MISAAIFDMDGLLIDSEPCWQAAEIEVFGRVGITLSDELCQETLGVRIHGVVEHWFGRFPWQGKTCQAVAEELTERAAELIALRATALPGAETCVSLLAARGLPLAVCSSSPLTVIDAALQKLGLREHFRVVHSAEDDEFGKPHPAPYLTVARRLGVSPRECLVFEDSLNGAVAAKAAGMQVVAVPAASTAKRTRFDFCDATLTSLAEFSAAQLERLARPGA